MIVHTMFGRLLQKVVYGAKAEVAAAAGFNGTVPDAFLEYYKKSGIEVRQAEGEAARIAEVFEKAKKEKFWMKWCAGEDKTRRLIMDGLWKLFFFLQIICES